MKKTITIFLIILFSSQGKSQVVDSLKHLLLESASDTEKVVLLNKISVEFRKTNVDSAFAYATKALSLAEESKDYGVEGLVTSLNSLGVSYAMKGMLDSAVFLFERSLSVNRSINDQYAIAKSLNNLGNVSLYASRLEKALEYYLESLIINESLNELSEIANVAGNLGIIYDRIGQQDKALAYYFKSANANLKNGNPGANSEVYANIGSIYFNKGNDSLSFIYQLKGLELFKRDNDLLGMARAYNNIGLIHESNDNLEKALEYFFKSVELREQTGEKNGLSISYHNIGNAYLNQKKYSIALEYLNKSRQIAEEHKYYNVLKDIYKNIAAVYAGLGQYENSYRFLQLHASVKDTIYNESSAQQIAEMQTKYETEKREQQIQMKSLEVEAHKKNNHTILFFSGVTIGLIVLSSMLFYNRNRIKQNALMNQELNKQQKMQFKAVLDAQEEERRRIAKDLHDGVGNELLALQLRWNKLSPALERDSVSTINKIMKDVTEEVRNVSHRMMPKVLDEFGFIPAIEDMLDKTLGYSQIKYRFETHNIKDRFDPRLEIAIYRICQELINNVIKHSEAAIVTIQMLKSKNSLILLVEDDGKGIKDKDLKDGIGLKSIKSRLSFLNGEINIEQANNAGTLVTIRIPLIDEQNRV